MIVGNGTNVGSPIKVGTPSDQYGAPIDDSYMVFVNDVPASVWTIAHNFGRLPIVTILDTNGNVMSPGNVQIDLVNVVITFPFATVGRAVIASVGGAYSDANTILVNPTSTSGYQDGTIILRTS